MHYTVCPGNTYALYSVSGKYICTIQCVREIHMHYTVYHTFNILVNQRLFASFSYSAGIIYFPGTLCIVHLQGHSY